MNAVSTPSPDFIQENAGDSDSDTNNEELLEYYQPIATEGGQDDYDDEDEEIAGESNSQPSLNGYARHCFESGVTALDLRDEEENGDNSSDKEEEEEEQEEARMREVVRAFREDEQRRSSPLTAENSMRVMEAMRGVSFGGTAPDWADRVPEDQWIQQLTRLRTSSPPSATSAAVHE